MRNGFVEGDDGFEGEKSDTLCLLAMKQLFVGSGGYDCFEVSIIV